MHLLVYPRFHSFDLVLARDFPREAYLGNDMELPLDAMSSEKLDKHTGTPESVEIYDLLPYMDVIEFDYDDINSLMR